ncbi:hypothetical protein CCYA_CCYA04G1230 [Cyanidiococcus yangmingshanensis]|nr:hypothetical protein CCYA_CCYA04G1230 [Cyanidiococcus yangmingshanensis]
MRKLTSPEDVFRFWFELEPSQEKRREKLSSLRYFGERAPQWFFSKDKEFERVQIDNVELVHRAGRGELHGDSWDQPLGLLARIILTDQFPRCIWRGRAEAFSYDKVARGISRLIIERGWDKSQFFYVERTFIYLPLMHSEDLADQLDSVRLVRAAADDTSWWTRWRHSHSTSLKMAEDHLRVIQRFGRFPYRNQALGRESTPEEIEWMNSEDLPVYAKSQTPASNQGDNEKLQRRGNTVELASRPRRLPASNWPWSVLAIATAASAAIGYRLYRTRHAS